MLIYNFVSSPESPITWGEYCDTNIVFGHKYPLKNSIWYLSFRMIKQRTLYLITIWLLHLLPALLIDTVRICTGQKPKYESNKHEIQNFIVVSG